MLLNSDLQVFKAELSDPETRHLRVEARIRAGIPLQIRAMREMRGWTQGQLAEKVGTTQNTISRLESPASNAPNVSTLERLAEAFDVGLIVRFAPFSDFFDFNRRMSKDSVAVPSFDAELSELSKKAEQQVLEYQTALDAHAAAPAPLELQSDLDPGYPTWIASSTAPWENVIEAKSLPGSFLAAYSQAFSGGGLYESLQKWIRNREPENEFNKLDGLSNSLESALLGHGVPHVNPPVDIGLYRSSKKGPQIETARMDLYDAKQNRA
jgi:transcriptional regulator with XRE-family HTH domain